MLAEELRFPRPLVGLLTLVVAFMTSLVMSKLLVLLPTPWVAVLLASGLMMSVVLIRKISWIFWLIVWTAPFYDHLTVNMGGTNLRSYNGLTMLALVPLFWNTMWKKPSRFQSVPPNLAGNGNIFIFAPLALHIICKMISAITVIEKPNGNNVEFMLKNAIIGSILFLMCYVLVCCLQSRERLLKLLQANLILGIIIALIAFIQVAVSSIGIVEWVHQRELVSWGRPSATFREPDVLGSLHGAMLLMTLPLIVGKVHVLPKKWLYFSAAIHGFMILVVMVRAAWVAFVFGSMVWTFSLLCSGRAPVVRAIAKKILISGAGLLVALSIAAPSALAILTDRFTSIFEPSTESASQYRIMEVEAMNRRMFELGAGDTRLMLLGNGEFSFTFWGPVLMGDAYNQDLKELGGDASKLVHPGTNMIMAIIFDNGFIGLGLMVTFWLALAWRYVQYHTHPEIGPIAQATFLPFVAILTCFVFSYDPIFPSLWVFIATFIGLCPAPRSKAARLIWGNKLHSNIYSNQPKVAYNES